MKEHTSQLKTEDQLDVSFHITFPIQDLYHLDTILYFYDSTFYRLI